MNKLSYKNVDFFNKIQNLVWPIKSSELKKFLPMSVLMFCVLFNQNILRILKDTLLISDISAEVVSFAKVYVVTPAATLFVVIYAHLLNKLTYRQIFNYLTVFFVGFFLLFAFIIYPNFYSFHLKKETLEALMAAHPHFKWFTALLGYWSYIIFYTLAELWPNIFYILLFWQLANEITSTSEAKRFYTHFSLIGNSSLIFVGLITMHLASDSAITKKLFNYIEEDTLIIQSGVFLVVFFAAISSIMVRYIYKYVLTDPLFYRKAKSKKESKPKMSLMESFKYIAKSKYLWLMLICSAAFGLSINLVEAVWKSKIKEFYPSFKDFASFNGLYILWTGVTIMVMTVIGNLIMRRYSWFIAAVVSPVIIALTGTIFFVLVVFEDYMSVLLDPIFMLSPLAMAVAFGAIQNILAKGSKYSIWDTSREMLYIPLDEELKTKGKAAVDVVSSKIGKASSGLIQSIAFTLFPTATLTSISPILGVVFVVVCLAWIYAVWVISHEYSKILSQSEEH